jgi:hypothetical protein
MPDLVVAVDEAGDFKTTSSIDHFYVAAIIRPGKEEQFHRWEAGIPAKGRKDGEVKGGYLTDDQLHDFVREVVCAQPRVIITRFAIQPSMHAPGNIRAHQAATVRLAEESAKRFRAQRNAELATEAAGLARWLGGMEAAQYVKFATQTKCVSQSLADVVGHSITGGFDQNLASLRYKIDRGLLGDSPEERLYWKRTVGMQVRRLAEDDRLVSLDTWDASGHPFLDLYDKDGYWDFNPLFDHRCDFLNSADHFELRIADIVASMHRTFHMSSNQAWRMHSAYARMGRCGAFARLGNLSKLFLDSGARPKEGVARADLQPGSEPTS